MNLKGFMTARVETVTARMKQAKAGLDSLRGLSQQWVQRVLAQEPIRDGVEELAKVRERLGPRVRELLDEGMQRLDQLNRTLAEQAIPPFRRKRKQSPLPDTATISTTTSSATTSPSAVPSPTLEVSNVLLQGDGDDVKAANPLAEMSPEAMGRTAAAAAKATKPRARKPSARKSRTTVPAGSSTRASGGADAKRSGKASAPNAK